MSDKIKIYYLLSFLGGFSFNVIAPLFVIFGLSLGFTIVQVGLLFGAIRLSVFVFEIPTGIFADSYGRKKSILLTYFLSIFSALVYFLSSNYYFLLIGSVIYGLALTFMTGAFEALIVDSLKLSNQDNLRNKIFIRLGIASTIGFIIGGLVGSGIAYFNLRYIWLAQALIAVIALILGQYFLKERNFSPQRIFIKQSNFTKIILNKIKNPLILIFKEKQISLMFFIAIIIALASAFYLISWPIIFKEILSIPVYYFGIISAVAGIFYLAGSLVAEKYSLKKGTIKTIMLSLLLMSVSYLIFGFSKIIILSLLCFILIDFFDGGFNPLFYSLLNKFIPSSQRATILSFYSLFVEGSIGIGEILAGSLLIIILAPFVVLISSALTLMGLIILFIIHSQSSETSYSKL